LKKRGGGHQSKSKKGKNCTQEGSEMNITKKGGKVKVEGNIGGTKVTTCNDVKTTCYKGATLIRRETEKWT